MTEYQAELEGAATGNSAGVEGGAPAKKARAPKNYPQFNEDGSPLLDEEGKQVWGENKFTGPGVAKKTYPQWNEDGTPLLDEAGVQVQGETRMKKPKVKKLYPQWNADGTPLLDDEGVQVQGETRMKQPKVVEFQKGEDGEFLLDEEGNKIPVVKVRAPRLDADGNPIPKRSNVFLDTQVLKLTDLGIKTQYRADSKRGMIFASIKDGMTVGEFYAQNGGKEVSHTFLVWYVNEAQVVEIETPQE